ncbi:hypothetical protein [Nocardioides sp. MH1]|uniref:hypothetical protein n=1 Tax=Nocardioides sp. MH1 TaxID=3242490 RepID=UPI003521A78C
MTFVFTREAPVASGDDRSFRLYEDLESRLRVKGVDGKLGHGRQGGGGGSRQYSMNFAPELNGTTEIEVTYLQGRKTVANEAISLGLEPVPAIARQVSSAPPKGPKVLYDDFMPVHYGFMFLSAGSEPSDDLNGTRAGQRNGLLGAQASHQLSMMTGLHTGEVPFEIEWHPDQPDVDASWQDVVEASVEFTESDALLSSFEEFVGIELPATGWYRARYCATGMDEGRELDTPDEDESAPDRYLLQIWPAPQAPDEVTVRGSQVAEYWHGVASGKNL